MGGGEILIPRLSAREKGERAAREFTVGKSRAEIRGATVTSEASTTSRNRTIRLRLREMQIGARAGTERERKEARGAGRGERRGHEEKAERGKSNSGELIAGH
jgi:hypothetical protein